jgi:alanyl-tRNA synthetase
VRQAGSYVGPDRLRFDFTHLEALKPEEISRVEALANEVVRSNIEVHVHHQSYEDAIAGGALAFFGEKYSDMVRVVGICEPEADACFSKELCGGTHCHASGDVGAIAITAETSIGAGMRRIEAVTGRAAVERTRRNEETLAALGSILRVGQGEVLARVQSLQDELETARKKVLALERQSARDESGALAGQAVQVNGVAVLAAKVEASNADYLRDLGDGLKAKLGSAVVLLGAEIDGRPVFLAMATPDAARKAPAGDIVRIASQAAGGGGGGRPELAQGGGTDTAKIDEALEAGRKLAEQRLSA